LKVIKIYTMQANAYAKCQISDFKFILRNKANHFIQDSPSLKQKFEKGT